MKKVLVTGTDGQLGIKIKELSKKISSQEFIFTDIDELDINNEKSVKTFCNNNSIGLLINCAAYTAVDKTEDDYDNALKTNCEAVKNLANASIEHHFKIIHISTDYVFDGNANTPYSEIHQTNPVNLYGKTKLEGEKALMKINNDSIILRTSWLYSEHGNNFLKTMLKLGKESKFLKVVFDQTGTPTYAGNLAEAILIICNQYLEKNLWHSGIYHFSNQGVCSWFDFAHEIFKLSGIKTPIIPVLSNEFPTKATRPKYSVLDKSKICNIYNIKIKHWTEGLKECFENL